MSRIKAIAALRKVEGDVHMKLVRSPLSLSALNTKVVNGDEKVGVLLVCIRLHSTV